MRVTTERQENCIVQLTISVDEAKENEYLRRSARGLSRRYRIRGFRPGKAPYSVIVQRLGIETVQAQVIDQFGDEIFEQGLEESGLDPFDQASLRDVTWEPLTLHLNVPVGPETHLGDYRAMRIPWGVPEVGDKEVDEELLRLQKEQSEWRPDDRPAELGDQVVLDIIGKVEDEIVLQNTSREMVLSADSPYPVPGFVEAVVGMEPEETREITLAYPDDHYNAEIAGKEGHFEVTLREIRVEVLPELDDEFAMVVGDYEDLDDLRSKIRASLEEQAQGRAEQEYEEQIWQELLESATIEYPVVMVDREVETMKSQLGQQLQQQGMDLDSYYRLAGTNEEAWAQEARPQAEDRVKRALLLSETVEQEELAVAPEEVEAEIEDMVSSLGEQGEQLRELFMTPGGRMSVMERLLTRRAVDRLKAIARGEDPPKGNLVSEGEEENEAEAGPEDTEGGEQSVAKVDEGGTEDVEDAADVDGEQPVAKAEETETEDAVEAEVAEVEEVEEERAEAPEPAADEPKAGGEVASDQAEQVDG